MKITKILKFLVAAAICAAAMLTVTSCDMSAESASKTDGNKSNVSLLANSNSKSDCLNTPCIIRKDTFMESDKIDALAVAYDVDGSKITPKITCSGTIKADRKVVITISVTGKSGAVVTEKYDYIVNHKDHVYTEDNVCEVCGIERFCYARSGNFIYFGEYPQSLKNKSVTVGKEADSDGYYLGSDGHRYAKVQAKPYNTSAVFKDGTYIVKKAYYYFKVEPIRWRVLKETKDYTSLMCDTVISVGAYDTFSTDYAKSDINAWLNSDFYKTAFSEAQQGLVLDADVSKVIAASVPENSKTAGVKVYLPSYSEVNNASYNLPLGSSEYMELNDYARAIGAYIKTDGESREHTCWWLRTERSYGSQYMYSVLDDGSVQGHALVSDKSHGIVPMMLINHIDGIDNDHLCDFGCGYQADDGCYDQETDDNHDCDECGKKDVTEHIDGNDTDHLCDNGCGKQADSGCYDAKTDKDHKCDECGKDGVSAHTDGNDDDHLCDNGCGEMADDGCYDVNTDLNHRCDECGADNVTEHIDGDDGDHLCDNGCKQVADSGCFDEDKNHFCDECGATVHFDSATDGDHVCDFECEEVIEACRDGEDSDHNCDVCAEVIEDCSDENTDQVCDECGAPVINE